MPRSFLFRIFFLPVAFCVASQNRSMTEPFPSKRAISPYCSSHYALPFLPLCVKKQRTHIHAHEHTKKGFALDALMYIAQSGLRDKIEPSNIEGHQTGAYGL